MIRIDEDVSLNRANSPGRSLTAVSFLLTITNANRIFAQPFLD